MPLNFAEKQARRVDIGERINSVSALIVAEYRGLTVEQLTQLRTELRKSDAVFKVSKNRIVKKALESEAKDSSGLAEFLTGPVGIVYSKGDLAQTTKSVLEFEKSAEKFKVRGALLDNNICPLADLKAIADLPSKEVLLGQIVGSLIAPHRGLMGVMTGVTRNLVQVIGAIRDKKGET